MKTIVIRHSFCRDAGEHNTAHRLVALLLLSGMLMACSDDGMSDLQNYVEQVKSEKQGQVEPLPEFKPFETFVYKSDEIKDPFTSWETQVQNVAQSSQNNQIHPDANRRKEVLEGFPLNSLLMMGTLEYKDQTWGLIKAPDGIVYRVKSGNYLGQNHGKIRVISKNKMALTEIVPDGLGGWEKRQASISLLGE